MIAQCDPECFMMEGVVDFKKATGFHTNAKYAVQPSQLSSRQTLTLQTNGR